LLSYLQCMYNSSTCTDMINSEICVQMLIPYGSATDTRIVHANYCVTIC